jgi:hypothetical protein
VIVGGSPAAFEPCCAANANIGPNNKNAGNNAAKE